MNDFTLYTNENAPQRSRDTLKAVEQKFGFIPNVLGQMAEAPAALQGLVQLLGLLETSSLTPAEQRVVLLAVSFENTSSYCMAGNSTVAQMVGVPGDIIEGLRCGEPLPDAKLEALRRFTEEMVRERGAASEETTRRFFEAGFTRAQFFEVVLGIALETMNTYTNRVAKTPVDEQFQAYAWTQPESAAAGVA